MNIIPPTDKAAHFGAGYIAAHLAAVLLGLWWAVPVAAAIGAAKEWLYDARTGGDVSVWDFVATALGGVAFTLATFI